MCSFRLRHPSPYFSNSSDSLGRTECRIVYWRHGQCLSRDHLHTRSESSYFVWRKAAIKHPTAVALRQETLAFPIWKNSFHFNAVSDIPFLGSQWNTLNLSNYESECSPLMSAPFEPNSITIIEMKGTEAIFHCAFCHPKRCTASCTVYRPSPPQRLIEMPKSKYYFIQMETYFHSRHDCAELRRYTLAWRHNLNCPICQRRSHVWPGCFCSTSTFVFWLLWQGFKRHVGLLTALTSSSELTCRRQDAVICS